MLDTVPVKIKVVTCEVNMCDYTEFEEGLQKVMQINVALYSVDCRRFAFILLTTCVLKIQFWEVVCLNTSRLQCLTLKCVCFCARRSIPANVCCLCDYSGLEMK